MFLCVGDKDIIQYSKQYSNNSQYYLYSYINDRILNGKANIFTANGTPEELQKILGDRLNSRVCLDSEIIVLKGNDMRGVIYD